MRSTSPAWKTCWRCMNKPLSEKEPVVCVDESRWCCMPMCVLRGPCGRAGSPGGIRSTSAAARPTSFAASSPKRGGTLPKPRPIAPRRSSPIIWWRSWPLSGGRNHPSGDGQPQLAYAQGAGGPVRREDRRPVVGTFYRALHPETRQLAEPGGDRDQPVPPPVPGPGESRRSQN